MASKKRQTLEDELNALVAADVRTHDFAVRPGLSPNRSSCR